MKKIVQILCVVQILCWVNVAYAGEHAHLAVFFDNGHHDSVQFSPVVKGDTIEQDMLKLGADMMLFAHSAGIQDGDVWTVRNDSLREIDGAFHDFGVNCELSLRTAPFVVSGLCAVFMAGHEGDGQERVKQQIRQMSIPDEVVWYKVFEDKEHGLAGYFMRETAADFNH